MPQRRFGSRPEKTSFLFRVQGRGLNRRSVLFRRPGAIREQLFPKERRG